MFAFKVILAAILVMKRDLLEIFSIFEIEQLN